MAHERIPDPLDTEYEHDILAFIKESVEEAEAFLKAQPGYSKIAESITAVMGEKADTLATGLSTVRANHIGKAATQLVSSMTDTRPFWEYRTFNPKYQKETQVFGKLAMHIWLQRQWDMRWADMIRTCATSGSAYSHITWDDDVQDMSLTAEDPRDVLPVRPSDYYSIQSAFGVIIRRERTVNYLKRRYPDKADWIVADRDGSLGNSSLSNSRYQRVMNALGSPFRDALFGKKRSAREIPRIPTADEYTMYLNDTRVHEKKDPLYMGEWHMSPESGCVSCETQGTPHALNNWSYIVKKGEPVYPRKRLIIATNSCVLYDNTSPYWHGMFPVSKLTLDPWPNTFLGKGLLWDALPMQKLLDRWFRLIDNHMAKWQQPDLFADKNSTAQSEFNKINTARPGLKVRYNPIAGKGMELRYPDALPSYIVEMGKFAIEEIGTLAGAQDLSQLMKLNQMPAGDAVESLINAMTPEVRLRSRILEAFTREFAMMTAYNFAQFYSLSQRLAILGPDGATFEDFDFDPGSLVPDYVHNEDHDHEGNVKPDAVQRGPRPRFDRAKEFLRQFSMHIAPGSLLNASEVQQQLLFLQLARAGWLDLWTLLDKLGVPNVGNAPPGADTIIARLGAMQELGLGMQVSAAGRKASGQDMPRQKISESG